MIGNCEVGKVIMAVMDNIETAGILLDYDATWYMFTDWAWFISYEKITNAHITVNSNNNVSMIGIGSVLFKARVSKGYSDIVLNNVLHVSYLEASLISMGTL